MKHPLSIALVFVLAMSATGSAPHAAGLPPALARTLGPADSLLVTQPDGRPLMRWNAETPRIPASVLKLLTAQVALAHLGADHRFETLFYQDPQGRLYVRGQGDPFWVSEIIAETAAILAPRLAPVTEIVLDDTYFARPLTIPGVSDTDNPYDAPNGALCANFNTIAVKRLASGQYVSDEPQTPTLPFMQRLLSQQGTPSRGRLVLTHDGRQATAYAGHLLRHFLETAGQPVSGAVRIAPVDPQARPVVAFASPLTLAEVIRHMMASSNNFMANQLLIAAGARAYGPPGTLDKAVSLASDYARRTLAWQHFMLAEGSGISPDNRVSAADLDKLLSAFTDHRGLLRHKGRAWYKTGTLSGVQTRAGYIEKADGTHYRFAILINTPGRRADPVLDSLMELLPS